MSKSKKIIVALCIFLMLATSLIAYRHETQVREILENQKVIMDNQETIKADHDSIKTALKRLNNGFTPESDIMSELIASYIKELSKRYRLHEKE
jgi:hypothetical protein